MSKSAAFANDWLLLVFNAAGIALLADNTATTPLTSLYVSLHTADPGEGGDQTTNETAYTGYARTAVARTAGGWAVTAGSVSPVADIIFGEATAAPGGDLTHWAVGTLASGAGKILYSGTVTPNIAMIVGTIPLLDSTSTITED
jgi:hypothetical protein